MHTWDRLVQVLKEKERGELGHIESAYKSPALHFASLERELWLPQFLLAYTEPPTELPKAFAVAAAAAADVIVAVEVVVLSRLWNLLEYHRMGCHMKVAAAGPTVSIIS